MSDLIDSRMGMLQTINQPTRDQLLAAQAWVEQHTDDPAVIREIMSMLCQPSRFNQWARMGK